MNLQEWNSAVAKVFGVKGEIRSVQVGREIQTGKIRVVFEVSASPSQTKKLVLLLLGTLKKGE